jgi:electron transfer flavoprotein alpha subunit
VGPTIVLADHDNKSLGDSTLNAVTAASKLGGSDVVVLVLGSGSGAAAVAAQASKVKGVNRVILVDDASFAHALAEQSTTIAAIVKETKYDNRTFTRRCHCYIAQRSALRILALISTSLACVLLLGPPTF